MKRTERRAGGSTTQEGIASQWHNVDHNNIYTHLRRPSSSPNVDKLNPSLGVAVLDIFLVEPATTTLN